MRVAATALALLAVASGLVAFRAGAATDAKPVPPREVQLKLVGRFDSPVYVTSPPGDVRRLFVVEKPGRIVILRDGVKLGKPFLDITSEVAAGNEPGLLSLAFSPTYARDGLFYVYYAGIDRQTHLLEFRRSSVSPERADMSSRREVLAFEHLSGEHFGGLLLFHRGTLYLSTGDGGFTEWQDKMRAQRLNDPNGKILQVNRLTGATRVAARGLRNPWRYTIDSKSGDLYVGDVGELVRESVKYAPAAKIQGTNFGWPCFEGNLPVPRYPPSMCPGRKPVLYEYAREGGNCSVIGGVVMHDPRLPRLDGRFLYGDHCLGELIVLNVKNGRLATRRSLRIYQIGITSFGVDARNRVYLTAAGALYRIDPVTKGAANGTPQGTSGKELFLAAGCGTCHTFTPARTGGTYGPNLDTVRPSRELVIQRVTWGKDPMPWYKGRLTESQIGLIADFVAGRR